ncbi:hypothetical protein AMK59_7522 [Oryctes borbonicus]|uniref:TROVE domain-containing protein n=1 Tax=Oryctes borbonicus TaxID=1629725 RepID=A0A0T6AZP3_9SCAR|nr:hypothetical protein AMK59_7522 [Oryctes borbonicus]
MSHKLTPEIRLKRFLYLSREDSVFVSGNPEKHNYYKVEKLTCASDLLKDDFEKSKDFLTNLFVNAESDRILPRREALFFALACLITNENAKDNQRHFLYSLVLNMCRSNEDLFTFIKFLSKIKKPFSSGVTKIVSAYYLRQDPIDLVKCVLESNSYHGWTHKDLIKLIHCKTDNQAIEVIIKYILYGKKKAEEAVGDDPTALKAISYIQQMKEYKTSNDVQKVAEFIPALNIKHVWQIPPSLIKSQVVWAAIIPQLSLNDLIASLPKLYRMGFLKSGPIQTKIIDIFCNNEAIRASNLHPVEFYIGLKNFEKGGKPKDPHLIKYLESKEDVEAKILADPEYKKPNFAHQEPAKCTPVINALQRALSSSYGNLKPVNKRILVSIDASEKMNEPCLTTKNVTCLEAAVFITYSLFKANKIVTVVVFNGTNVTPVPLEKNITLAHFYKKVKEAKHSATIWSAPLEWAAEERKPFDVFILMGLRSNLVDLPKELREIDKPKEAFSSYMQKMNLPYVRLVVCSLSVHNTYFSDGATNILDICGFDKNVPNIIDTFCRNLF